MTSGNDSTSAARRSGSRRELAAVVVAGAAGATIVLLALRPTWAHVLTAAPPPIPASKEAVTGSALAPFAEGFAIAALATLLAVLATAGLARRLAGLLLAALGIGLVSSVLTISTSAALAAAAAQAGPATTPGSTAGSTTQGNGTAGQAATGVTGFPRHALLAAGGWQALAITGALLIILAGAVVAWRARQMATMSARYDLPTSHTGSEQALVASPELAAANERQQAEPPPADTATLWEALSRGDDPTLTAR